MKPTKNKVFCKDCERTKMLFETEKKAENFMKFNSLEIMAETGYSPQRSYYCLFCDGWHVTSSEVKTGMSKNEQRFEQLMEQKEQEEQNKAEKEKLKTLERKIRKMKLAQKEVFFAENIELLKSEIELITNDENSLEKEKLKELRQNLSVFYLSKKQNEVVKTEIELPKTNKNFEEAKEKEIEEWRLWAGSKGY